MGLDGGWIRPELKARIIESLRPGFKLRELLAYAKMSKSTFYYHKHRFDEPDRHELLRARIVEVFEDNEKRYGYRRITGELRRRGIMVNHETVCSLMKEVDIRAVVREGVISPTKAISASLHLTC